jgi:anti-sigma B factor antagonist
VLNIAGSSSEGLEVISLEGEIDMYVAPEVRNALFDACKRSSKGVLVELQNVTYMDSSGIATLIEGVQCTRKEGKRFALIGAQENVMGILRLAKLDRFFDIYSAREDALAAKV